MVESKYSGNMMCMVLSATRKDDTNEMKIGIIQGADKDIYVNVLVDANTNTIEELRECLEEGEGAIALLDTDSLKFTRASSNENLKEAFDLLHGLASLNHFYEGSICHALEELLRAVFWEGMKASLRSMMPVPFPDQKKS